VVAAVVAAQPKEVPMTKTKSKRKSVLRTNDSKTKTRNSGTRTTARKAVQPKPVIKPAIHRRPRSAARRESKKSLIIAMLQAPAGATVEAMAGAAKWQPHSVRGFLAGVVRKKLGLTLVSADGKTGRVYRIMDRTASVEA
jgi:hypothetical protein